ncbi:hypothetical protein [Affinirhizobium pseudoryzae]|uniref:hypothetical protein n=1 Tax=Allorhizobium pseudoryzae TaxID=379684 RepID=UPI0013E9DC3A|nr:hypothetical protein [Allorhizobium pseudoryzae]
MMDYRLTCTNHSHMHGNFILFQFPGRSEGSAQIRSLAWRTRAAAPGTRVTFCWQRATSFVWGEQTELNGRHRFTICEDVPADMDRDNAIDLRSDEFGAPKFGPARAGQPSDSLTIRQMNARFDHPVQHGIALGGNALMAAPFHANVSTAFVISLHRYRIHFGDYEAGEALNSAHLDHCHSIEFSAARPSLSVVLGPDNIIRTREETRWP